MIERSHSVLDLAASGSELVNFETPKAKRARRSENPSPKKENSTKPADGGSKPFACFSPQITSLGSTC